MYISIYLHILYSCLNSKYMSFIFLHAPNTLHLFLNLTEAFAYSKCGIHCERNPKLPGLFGPSMDLVFLRNPPSGLHKFIVRIFSYANKQTSIVISLTHCCSIKIPPAVRK